MRKKSVFVFIWIFSYQVAVSPQQNIDSMKSRLILCSTAVDSLETLISISNAYSSISIDSCFRTGQLALTLAHKLNDSSAIARIYLAFGNTCHNTAIYERALEYYQRAKEIFEMIKDEVGLAKAYNNIGLVYDVSGKYKMAIEYYNASVEIQQKVYDQDPGSPKSIKMLALLYNNIGVVYDNLDSVNQALEFYNKSLNLVIETENNAEIISSAMGNIGLIHLGNKNYKTALNFFLNSLKIDKEGNNLYGMAISYNNIGNVYFQQGQYEQARSWYYQSYKLASEIKATELIKNACDGLYRYYLKMEIADSALIFLRIFYELQDSIFSVETKTRIAELENKYLFEKKEKEIEFLNVEKQMKDIKLRNSKKWNFVLAAAILVALIFIVMIYFQKRQKSRINKQLVKKNLELVKSEEFTRLCLEKELHKSEISEQLPGIRYAASLLTEQQKEDLKTMISVVLETEKPFLKSNFTIENLSSRLNISRTYISQVINEKFNMNFNNLINEYRVKEVIRLMNEDSTKTFTLEAIGLSVGFGSKSSFNAAFKKYTGTTPSVFLKYSKKVLSAE